MIDPTGAGASQAGDVRERVAEAIWDASGEVSDWLEWVAYALKHPMHQPSVERCRRTADAVLAALQPAPVAPEPAIKPLVWSEPEQHPPLLDAGVGPGLRTKAMTIIGDYVIDSFDGDKSFTLYSPGSNYSDHANLQAARAAAQAHFEALIRSAFVPQGEPS